MQATPARRILRQALIVDSGLTATAGAAARSVQLLAAELRARGIEVIERRIMPEELSGFSECFITGTAAEVTAVGEIAQWKFTPSQITRQLQDDYSAEVQPKGKAAAA